MNVWRHIPTIFKQRHVLRIAGLLSLCVALITTLLFADVSRAQAGINRTLSFQGRLLNSSGGVVADGHYNIQFKIYQDGTGTTAGNPGGTLKWTESYVNNGGTSGVEVKNGYFSVALGSNNPFDNDVDWNQDTLWLSMNIAGSATGCTTFGSSPCTADGEMLPMKRITSTPFSLNSGMLEGKTAANFVQLAQGVQTDASFNTSIAINKTGGGNLIELQSSSVDVLTIEQDGDLIFGSNTDHSIFVNDSTAGENGKSLNIQAGTGGSGSGTVGGTLTIQGGTGGGTDGHGGWVSINAGAATGSGNDGTILVGEYNTQNISIGTTSEARTQNISIGVNNTTGATTNVTIGSGGSATGGTTAIQSKNDTTISTNGTQRARFSGNGNTLYVGNADSSGNAETASGFTIQGTSSTGINTQGGYLSLIGGSATNGNADGGDIYISGGEGSGTGGKGLTIIDTPTFSSAPVQSSASSINVFQSDIDKFGIVNLNATANNVTFTLTAPSRTTNAAGRIIYVTAVNGSNNFILKANTGGGIGVEQTIPMKQNTSATLVWTGSLWTVAGSATPNSLQSTYDSNIQSAGDAVIVTSDTSNGNGLVIRQGSADTANTSILSVQSAGAAPLLSVNSLTDTELARNGGAETAGATASEFPINTWRNSDDFADDPEAPWDSVVTRYTTAGNNIATGNASVKVVTTNNYTGARNKLNAKLTPGVSYTVNAKLRAGSGSSFTDMIVALFPTGTHGEPAPWCQSNISVTSSAWTNVSCTFTATANVTSNNDIFITPNSETGTFYIDDFSVTRTTASSNVQIGGNDDTSNPTYLTLGKSATPPTDGTNDSLLGSMYYDTTLGKVQCYEEDGWGACGAAPDNFVTLSPQYANAVMNGNDIGTISSDLCSDTLNINDGSSGQPTICGTNETFNFYKWTSAETSNQTRSIYVTYQLPSTFKSFVSGLTSLMGRTNSADSSVAYQIYRDDKGNGLVSCGSAISVSTGNQSTWQKATATGTADPANCSFEPGDSILFRINLTAKDNANAYVSNLNFTISNN